MKNHIWQRVMVGVIIALILGVVRKAVGQQIDFHSDNYQFDHNIKVNYFTVVFSNPSASPITVAQSQSYPATGQMTISGYGNGAHQVRVWAASFAAVTIPPGGTLTKTLNLSGGNDIGQTVSTFSAVQTWSGTLRLEVNGATVAKTLPAFTFRIKAVGTTVSDYISPAAPYDLGTVPLATPAPLGKITVVADAAAAGADRTYQIGAASPVSVTLVQGANVILNSALPSAFPDGASVVIRQTGQTIGTGTIAKDGFGNFDLSINAVGLPSAGVVTITWPALFNGQGATLTEGFEAPLNITLSGASVVQTYNPGSVVPNGTIFVVKVNGTPVGTGVVVYQETGGWAVNIVLQGAEDLEPGVNEALFVLDLAAYNNASVVLVLVVDGVEYSVGTVAGDAAKGIRSVKSYRIANPDGLLNGKKYAWKITGVDGANVYQGVSIASGITPSIVELDVGSIASSKSFRVDNSATINGEAPDGPPANDYDPAAPPVHDPGATPEQIATENKRVADKKDNYEAVNKAVGDAVNASSVANAAMPGTGEGKAGGELGQSASLKAKGAVEASLEAAGLSGYVPVGTWHGTSALQIGLPGAGIIYLDATDYGIAPSVIRAVILMGLLWVYWKTCIHMLRDSMAN